MVIFMIVGKSEPLYEANFSPSRDESSYIHQFVLHSSLDMVETAMWGTTSPNLRVVDRFNNMLVSAYVTAGGVYFLLLHEGRSDESIKNFFVEAHELYVKNLLNPFYQFDSPIVSSAFDTHIKALARRYLL